MKTQLSLAAFCTWPGCHPYRVVSREKLLSTGREYDVCRRHRTVLGRWNAQHIGHCQWHETRAGYRDPQCELTPVAMMLLDADEDKVAVCRKHQSVINAMYARSRAR